PAADVVPDALRRSALTKLAARRDLLARFVSLGGAVSIDDILARYDFERSWIEERLDEWTRGGKLVRGTFGGDAATTRWCSRRLLEQARRRELAQARKQIEAVDLAAFARFEQRWQHLAPDDRVSGHEGTMTVMSQLHGLARPADGWERDYLPSRIEGYDASSLARLAASGALVWAAEPRVDEVGAAPSHALGRLRFFERGTGRLWLRQPIA